MHTLPAGVPRVYNFWQHLQISSELPQKHFLRFCWIMPFVVSGVFKRTHWIHHEIWMIFFFPPQWYFGLVHLFPLPRLHLSHLDGSGSLPASVCLEALLLHSYIVTKIMFLNLMHHVTCLFKNFQWLPISQHIKPKFLSLGFKTLHISNQ